MTNPIPLPHASLSFLVKQPGGLGCKLRVALWLDSISPQQAHQRFRRCPARSKRQFHMAARHAASARLLANHEVVIYHWQMSHVGEPANEWADVEAAARAEAEEILPLVEPDPWSYSSARGCICRRVRGR